jgi:pimeloyl-ACP methyl ester carboxylesterase
MMALAAVGGGYETVRGALDEGDFPMSGQLIDVGGHSLHLSCSGSGSPTVVLEPGAGEMSSVLAWITPAVARDTRVCVYDRAGRGWSEPADSSQDGAQIATDLHTLLQRGHVPGPYVLTGHSLGGLYALTFAARYPDEVAGMVLVDSTAPASAATPATSPGNEGSYDIMGRVSALLSSSARLGLGRLIGQFEYGSLPPRPRDEHAPAPRPLAMFKARSTSTSKRRPRWIKLHLSVTSPTSPWSSWQPAAGVMPNGHRHRTTWPPCRSTACTA